MIMDGQIEYKSIELQFCIYMQTKDFTNHRVFSLGVKYTFYRFNTQFHPHFPPKIWHRVYINGLILVFYPTNFSIEWTACVTFNRKLCLYMYRSMTKTLFLYWYNTRHCISSHLEPSLSIIFHDARHTQKLKERSSYRKTFYHWLHRRLSTWQPPVHIVMKSRQRDNLSASIGAFSLLSAYFAKSSALNGVGPNEQNHGTYLSI